MLLKDNISLSIVIDPKGKSEMTVFVLIWKDTEKTHWPICQKPMRNQL